MRIATAYGLAMTVLFEIEVSRQSEKDARSSGSLLLWDASGIPAVPWVWSHVGVRRGVVLKNHKK